MDSKNLNFLSGKNKNVEEAYRYGLQHFSPVRFQHCIDIASILEKKISNASMLTAALLHGFSDNPEDMHLLEDAPITSWDEVQMIAKLFSVCTSEDPLHWPTFSSIDNPRLQLLFAAHAVDTIHHLSRWNKKERNKLCQKAFSKVASNMRELNLYDWAEEIEDICFLEMNPEIFGTLKNQLEISRDEDIALLKMMAELLANKLKNRRDQCLILHRIKNLYGVYRKTQKYQCSVYDVRDRLGLRVICRDEKACYHVLTSIQSIFQSLPPPILKDYIANPKENGYQSIHIYVLSPINKIQVVEIQIKSESMHWHQEFGAIGHANYKNNHPHRSIVNP